MSAILVYDTRSDVCRVLNKTTALIWNHCDGERTVSELARVLAEQTGLPASEEIVHLAIEGLAKAELLVETEPRPPRFPRTSRRQLLHQPSLTAGLALALPVVESAPQACCQSKAYPKASRSCR